MRKLALLLMLALLPSSAFGQTSSTGLSGVEVQGKCKSTGPIASAAQMDFLQVSFASAILAMTQNITRTLQEQTQAMQTTMSAEAEAEGRTRAAMAKAGMIADAEKENLRRTIYDTPVISGNPKCPDLPPSYFLQRINEDIAVAVSESAAHDKNIGGGIEPDLRKRDILLGAAAKDAEKFSFPFAADTYTQEQMDAWMKSVELFLPEWKNPRPKLPSGSLEEARYLIYEARAREMRVILNEPLRMWGYEHMAAIPAADLYKWAGPAVNRPVTIKFDVNDKGMVDLTKKPKVEPIPPTGKMSRKAMLDLIAKRYTSSDFLAQVDAKDAAGVLKEQIRLDGFEYTVLLDIRNALQINNILLSLGLMERYEKINQDPSNILR